MGQGPEFFQTVMGHRFYERDVPKIADALTTIANEMRLAREEQNKPHFEVAQPTSILEVARTALSRSGSDSTVLAKVDCDALNEIAERLRGDLSDASAVVDRIIQITRSTGRK